MRVASVTERFFPPVAKWQIPRRGLDASHTEMACDGLAGNEGTALWLGNRSAGVAAIKSVVLLRGPGIIRRPGFISISSDLINEVTDVAIEIGQVIVAQIHSHEFEWTELSPVDKAGGFRVPGFLSIVAPNFAQDPALDLRRCGIYLFDSTWRQLSETETTNSIVVDPTGDVVIVTVGE
jgi:hypothetical protein